MFSPFRNVCERVLRIPPEPEPPPGDEASTLVFNAAPNYYKYLFFMWALVSLVELLPPLGLLIAISVVSFRFVREGYFGLHFGLLLPVILQSLVLVVFLLLRSFALALVRLNFEKRWYLVTDRSLRVREGIVGVREITVTFANIQNISISQGPIQRALGIADLRVDTAGGGAVNDAKHPGMNLHTAWFRGVSNAGEVRELIQQRLRQFRDAGLGDHEDQSDRFPTPSPFSADFIAALRALRDEAGALRLTVSAKAMTTP